MWQSWKRRHLLPERKKQLSDLYKSQFSSLFQYFHASEPRDIQNHHPLYICPANAQLPLSCTRWCLICSLPLTCIWHTQPLSKTKCNSTRQRVMRYTATSYLQSLLDNTCPRFQHGRFSESCQIPNQLLPSCLKLLGYLLSSVASKMWSLKV